MGRPPHRWGFSPQSHGVTTGTHKHTRVPHLLSPLDNHSCRDCGDSPPTACPRRVTLEAPGVHPRTRSTRGQRCKRCARRLRDFPRSPTKPFR